MEQLCHGRCITENFAGCHDPVAEYVENPCSDNVLLCSYSKDQIPHHNFFPLSPSALIKNDEGAQSLDQLLGWIHWKSKFT